MQAPRCLSLPSAPLQKPVLTDYTQLFAAVDNILRPAPSPTQTRTGQTSTGQLAGVAVDVGKAGGDVQLPTEAITPTAGRPNASGSGRMTGESTGVPLAATGVWIGTTPTLLVAAAATIAGLAMRVRGAKSGSL